ncbi:flagellar protein, FliL [Methanobrevibacter sp.]
MKGFILLILGIIAVVLVVGGATAYNIMTEIGMEDGNFDSGSVGEIIDKVSNVATSDSSDSDSSSSDKSIVDKVGDIVSEEVKFNAQNGEGYYREVTYSDGGFRQYDTETGDLIGSSYDSDQDQLPSME